jgi:diguanylate cyclase (GGDEF)-like protein
MPSIGDDDSRRRKNPHRLEKQRHPCLDGGKLGWQDSHACTTSVLRPFLRGAYTGEDSQLCAWIERIHTSHRRLPGGRFFSDCKAAIDLGGCKAADGTVREEEAARQNLLKEQVQTSVEEVKQFPAVDRRRNPAVPAEQRVAGEIAIFQELGKALTSSLQLDQVLRTIMEKIDEFLRPDNWSLLLLDETTQELYFELAVGKASQALKDVRIKVGQGIAGWVAQRGETVVVPDTAKDTRFFGKVDEKTKTETQSIVAVPVRFRDTCLGVIELINCVGPEGFDPRDLKLLEALADFAAIALENARHVKRIHELTIKDDCTSLYNARHMSFILETEIYRSQRYDYEFSIVFIDLDHFKQVNDTHGHLVGSRLLGEIGNALKEHCRLIDFAFRYGGDEFVILLPQTSKESALNVARRLHKLIRETTWLVPEGLNIKLTPSVGIASYPVDSRTKEGLLHLADEAMYLVKNTSRDSVAAANFGILPDTAASAESAG